MRKKLIGILVTQGSLTDSYKGNIIGIEEQYLKLFSQYGRVIAVMPDQRPSDIKLDLLVLPGGADLDTSFTCNGEDCVVGNGASNPMYSQFYKFFLKHWLNANVPVFGICLGFQALNVCLGGGLTSDGPNHSLSGLHPIGVYNEKLGLHLPATKTGVKKPYKDEVNSRHHQFIRPNQLAKCLLPLAIGVMNDNFLKVQDDVNALWEASSYLPGSPGLLKYYFDGTVDKLANKRISHIEAYIHVSQKIAGVQWHPESMWRTAFGRGDEVSHKIIEWLLEGEDPKATVSKNPTPTKVGHNQVVV